MKSRFKVVSNTAAPGSDRKVKLARVIDGAPAAKFAFTSTYGDFTILMNDQAVAAQFQKGKEFDLEFTPVV